MGVRFFFFFDGVDGKKNYFCVCVCVSPFSSGADACGMKRKKKMKENGMDMYNSTDSTYNHRKDLVIAYSSSSRRAMDGWNSAVSSSKMTSKL